MPSIVWVPGAFGAGVPIPIPAGLPPIDRVIAAVLTRIRNGLAIPNHLAADIQGGAPIVNHLAADIQGGAPIVNHLAADIQGGAPPANHDHDLLVLAGGVGAPAEAFGASGAGVADLESVTGQGIVGGVPGTGGVQNQVHAYGAGAPLVHAFGAGAPLVHAFGAGAPLAHAFGAGAPVAHGAPTGTDPVVAALPTKVNDTTITLSVPTTLGDLLSLNYEERGARLHI